MEPVKITTIGYSIMFSIMLYSEVVTIRFAADVRILKYFELKLKV